MAVSVKLNDDADTAEVTIYHSADTATSSTNSGIYYLDDATAYKAIVGAWRTTSTSDYDQFFTGFMYGLWIENVY